MEIKRTIRKIKKRFFLRISNGIKVLKVDEVAITPTMKCCLNCAMCHQKEIKHWPNMSLKDFEKLLINFKKRGISKISLVGGEIFVHPDIFKFIELMEKKDFKYDLSSNLFFVPGGVNNFKKLKGLEMITTSIDGIGKQHDQIRGVSGAFEKTVDNILKIVEMKIPIDVACVIQAANYSNLEEIVRFICSLKVNSVTLLVENNLSEEEKKLNQQIIKRITTKNSEIIISSKKNPLGEMIPRNWDNVIKSIKSIKKITKRKGCSLNLSTQLLNPSLLNKNCSLKDYTCGSFRGYNLIIYNDSSLPFCGFIKLEGDYNASKGPLKSIINSKSYTKLRSLFKKGGALPMCRMCCGLQHK